MNISLFECLYKYILAFGYEVRVGMRGTIENTLIGAVENTIPFDLCNKYFKTCITFGYLQKLEVAVFHV